MHDDDLRWSKIIPHSFIGVVWMVVLVGVISGGSVLIYRTFGPAAEQARREVYEESKSYIDGTIRDLDNIRNQWFAADDSAHKGALAATALHRSVDFPEEELPDYIAGWLDELRQEREGR